MPSSEKLISTDNTHQLKKDNSIVNCLWIQLVDCFHVIAASAGLLRFPQWTEGIYLIGPIIFTQHGVEEFST